MLVSDQDLLQLFKEVEPCPFSKYARIVDADHSVEKVIIVPDVHGRPELVRAALDQQADRVVFVGDIIHREDREAWERVDDFVGRGCYGEKFFSQLHKSPDLQEEIQASLTCWKLILSAKSEQPERIHFVRGNHDDTEGLLVGTYGKYSQYQESVLWDRGLHQVSPELHAALVSFERKIPYVYLGQFRDCAMPTNIIVSHSLPHSPAHAGLPKFNHKLTHETYAWSDNTGRNANWVQNPNRLDRLMESNFDCNLSTLDHWFCGHRPANDTGGVREQLDGRVVQLNNQHQHILVEYYPQQQRTPRWTRLEV